MRYGSKSGPPMFQTFKPGTLLRDRILYLFTDGSGGRDGVGGWGVVMRYNMHLRELSGGAEGVTSNAMEYTAILRALEAVQRRDTKVVVCSDSQYCLRSITEWRFKWERNDWRTQAGTPVKNLGLLQQIIEQTKTLPDLTWCWVRGHANDPLNEKADQLATRARAEFQKRRKTEA